MSDGSDLTRASNAFQALAAVSGKARSPSVERLVGGTSSVTVSLDSVCRIMLRLICMVYVPSDRRKPSASAFRSFSLSGIELKI